MGGKLTPTDGQAIQLLRLIHEMNPTRDQYQMLIESADLFREMINCSNLRNIDRLSFNTLLGVSNCEYVKNNGIEKLNQCLRSLDHQLAELKEFNPKITDNLRFPDSWFDNIDISSGHNQSINDLEFLFVVRHSLRETIEYQVKLMELKQPNVKCINNFDFFMSLMQLDTSGDIQLFKKPGIHRLRINLDDKRFPKNISSVNQLRDIAQLNDRRLAGVAAIGAIALQDIKLCQSLGRDSLPDYICMPEIQLINHSEQQYVPYISWLVDDRSANFGLCPDKEFLKRSFAIPTLI
jgi:hypothetical protein